MAAVARSAVELDELVTDGGWREDAQVCEEQRDIGGGSVIYQRVFCWQVAATT